MRETLGQIAETVIFLAALCFVVVLAPSSAQAADLIWDNGSGDSLWNTTSTNWSGTATWSNSVPDNAVFTATGAGAVTLGEAITAGAVDITAGAYTFSQSGGSLSFTTLNSTGSDQVFFNGGVLTGTGTINNTIGRLVVYGNNSSYSGTINHLSGAENLYVDNANSLGTGTLNLSGGFLTCDNSPTLNSVLTINATGGRLGGNGVNDELRIAGTLNLNSGGTGVTFNDSINNRTLRFKSGATIGGDAASVTVGRSTTFIESGVNITYAGSFVITRTNPGASVLNLGNGIDLSSSGSNNTIIFSDGGVNNQPRMVQVSAGGASAIIGNVAQNETTEGLAVLSAGADNTLTVAGVMSGRDISIQGGGTVIMTGNNTYVGQTSIQAGTLLINGDNSAAGGAVNVQTNATLGGTGSIGGNVVVNNGGVHSPGSNGVGVQKCLAAVSYKTGSKVLWQLGANSAAGRGTAFDGIDVGGNLSFDTAVALALEFNQAGSTVEWTDDFWNVSRQWLIWDVAGTIAGGDALSLTVANWADSQDALFDTVRPRSSFSVNQADGAVYLKYDAPLQGTVILVM